jgi:hypothetical protein
MRTSRVLFNLLMTALLLSGAARAADRTITVVAEQGRTVAEFKVGDSQCVLDNDRLSCTPIGK